jgi:hypothetical protein
MQHHELIEGKAFARVNRARFWPANGSPLPRKIENGDLIRAVHLDDDLFASGLKGSKSLHPIAAPWGDFNAAS